MFRSSTLGSYLQSARVGASLLALPTIIRYVRAKVSKHDKHTSLLQMLVECANIKFYNIDPRLNVSKGGVYERLRCKKFLLCRTKNAEQTEILEPIKKCIAERYCQACAVKLLQ